MVSHVQSIYFHLQNISCVVAAVLGIIIHLKLMTIWEHIGRRTYSNIVQYLVDIMIH